MANRGNWLEMKLSPSGEQEQRGWKCADCGLLIGGAPVTARPGPCPVCAARSGRVVAVVAAGSDRLSMLMLDKRLISLIDEYRTAKRAHERESTAHALIGHLGNYDTDDDLTPSAEIDASAAREQRSAFALADAALDSTRESRASVP